MKDGRQVAISDERLLCKMIIPYERTDYLCLIILSMQCQFVKQNNQFKKSFQPYKIYHILLDHPAYIIFFLLDLFTIGSQENSLTELLHEL